MSVHGAPLTFQEPLGAAGQPLRRGGLPLCLPGQPSPVNGEQRLRAPTRSVGERRRSLLVLGLAASAEGMRG